MFNMDELLKEVDRIAATRNAEVFLSLMRRKETLTSTTDGPHEAEFPGTSRQQLPPEIAEIEREPFVFIAEDAEYEIPFGVLVAG